MPFYRCRVTQTYVFNLFNSFVLSNAWSSEPTSCIICTSKYFAMHAVRIPCIRTTQGFMSNIDSCVKMQKSSRWHINCNITQTRWVLCWRKILWEKVGSCMITLLNIFLWYILNSPPPWQENLPPSIYCAICYTTYTSIIYRLWYNVLSLDAVRSWVLIISWVHLHVVKLLF